MMDANSMNWIFGIAGLAAGMTAAGAFFVPKLNRLTRENAILGADLAAQDKITAYAENHFKASAQEALKGAHELFLQMAQERLKQSHMDGAHDLEKRQKAISDLVDPIGKSLKEMETKIENLGKAGAGLESQLKTFSDIQNRLRDETSNLTRALRNPGQGGRWGEMHLQRTLEAMGMSEWTHFRKQVHTSVDGEAQKPDFILDMPSGLHIVVDVKTPLDPYLEMTGDNLTDEQKSAAAARLHKALRGHLTELSRKEYWLRFNSPDFVVMYLPSEGLFSTVMALDSMLMEDAAQKRIIIASPTTFMGLARIAHYGWQQQNIAEEASKIAALGSELFKRFVTFAEHIQKIGAGLNGAVKSYDNAVGSLQSMVLPSLKKLKDEHHVQAGAKEIPDLQPLTQTVRSLTAPEFEKNEEKKRA